MSQPKKRLHWADDSEQAQTARSMSGIEQVRAMMAGTVASPPIASLIGWQLEIAEIGHAVLRFRARPELLNLGGTLHGGVMATLLDSALGCALITTMPPGRRFSTLELKVNYVRPVSLQTGDIWVHGTVVQSGKRTGVVEGRVVDKDGLIYAIASTTCLNFEIGE